MAPLGGPVHAHCETGSAHDPHEWVDPADGSNGPIRRCCGAWPVARTCPHREGSPDGQH